MIARARAAPGKNCYTEFRRESPTQGLGVLDCLKVRVLPWGVRMSAKSEIRKSDITALASRVNKKAYDKYLRRLRMVKLRGFSNREVTFDFPVTALVGPNGSGKTTILGAAALIHRKVLPRQFFAKSGKYDDSMKNWRVEYEILDKREQSSATISRTASYLKAKWNRDAVERDVLTFGVSRTLPASERKELSKFIGGSFEGFSEEQLTEPVIEAVESILGKDAGSYLRVSARSGDLSIFASLPSGDGAGYSEFHFGAGEASVIRIVSQIESSADNALILIEEIENGLHPVATRRLVEYLIKVAKRKSCQVIFTTHSNDALFPLPNEAVWVAYRGEVKQGKLDVASLRALTGQINARLVVFTEDRFGEMVADVTLRAYCQKHGIDRSGIEVHKLGGAAPARDHTRFHNSSPARRFFAIALLDGDKRAESGFAPQKLNLPDEAVSDENSPSSDDLLFIPGEDSPEAYIMDRILEGFDSIPNLLGKLAISLHLDTFMQERVREVVTQRALTNHDRHNIFAQIGEDLDFLSEDLVQRAFITTWSYAYPDDVDLIWGPAGDLLRLKE
ncbi:ATP-dependent nuclease [Streptomyces murinus]|uniref:ATP-dependent nuclease n=1 Tax=Streptomyces murinus TaxID=33900 RepID=UPI001F324844|nr:AAA family ATPase [Streptomyces murinus]